jgi:dihydroorotase-like cyclic amidohydrolase
MQTGQPMQDEGTARALYLAQYVNTPVYIVHVMSKGAAGEIAAAKLRGQRVIGETIASGIAAEEKKIWDPDFKVNIISATQHCALPHAALVCAYRILQ